MPVAQDLPPATPALSTQSADAENGVSARAEGQPRVAVHATGLDARKFVLGSVGTVVGSAMLLAMVYALINQPEWWRGYLAGTVAAIISLAVSIIPTLFLFKQPLPIVMNGFLAIGGLRAAAMAGVIITAVNVGGYPKIPTVLTGAILYTTLVTIEGLLLWTMISTGIRTTHVPMSTSTTQEHA